MAKIPINISTGSVQKSELIIGIDLGTTNSLVAFVNDEKPEVVRDRSGKYTLVPSIIHLMENGDFIVGDHAKEKLITEPERTIYSVKRLMGKSYNDVSEFEEYISYRIIDEDTEALVKIAIGNRFYTPIDLSAEILKYLKKRIENRLGQEVQKAVITVPAYFNDTQRQATRDAGKLAGLDVLRIVNEPTAASLAYGFNEGSQDEKKIAVYDLGGGTFDVSILQIKDGIFEVLSTNGDTFLGGDDFDRLIIDHWKNTNQINSDQFESDQGYKQEVRLLAEKAKKVLSTENQFKAIIGNHEVLMERAKFESLIDGLVNKTLNACKQALEDAQLTAADIDHIIMVGGSTRIPFVKNQVSNFFGKDVHDRLNPDEVVALGAAVQANILAGNEKGILLLDITPLSLGIETLGGLMDVIIPRNSKVPTKAGRQYTTSIDGQKNLKISVYQGERDLVSDNRKLGEFILKGIPPMPAGIPKIEIQFILDADGVLIVKAKELRSGIEQKIEIRSQYGLSEEEMAQMLMDSFTHAEDDMKARSLLEARNEARNIILSSRKFIQQHKDLFDEATLKELSSFTDSLEKLSAGEDKDSINKAIEDLNEYSRPLAEIALDNAIQQALKGKKLV